MEALKQLLRNYEMGFLSPLEFILKYRDILSLVGADTELGAILNQAVTPLANHLAGILRGSELKISDFNIQ
jgi:hypothetical protein